MPESIKMVMQSWNQVGDTHMLVPDQIPALLGPSSRFMAISTCTEYFHRPSSKLVHYNADIPGTVNFTILNLLDANFIFHTKNYTHVDTEVIFPPFVFP